METLSAPKTIKLFRKYPSEWNSYRAAKYRCTSPNASDYKYYGGRGIEFRFESFEDFLLELGRKPSPDYTVDRIDTNGHYEPGNVKWSTRREQMNNIRNNHLISAFGQTLTVAQWARRTGIKIRNIHFRHNKGWCINCILSPTAKTCVHGYNKTERIKHAQRNRKNNRLITANGKTLTVVEWSEITGLKQTCISMRFHKYGWCQTCTVTLKPGEKCNHNKKVENSLFSLDKLT